MLVMVSIRFDPANEISYTSCIISEKVNTGLCYVCLSSTPYYGVLPALVLISFS